jgi:hypothetical protein
MTPQFFAVWSLVDHGEINEPAADPGDFDYFDGAAVCSGARFDLPPTRNRPLQRLAGEPSPWIDNAYKSTICTQITATIGAVSPLPWSVEEQPACFVVRDHNGQALA